LQYATNWAPLQACTTLWLVPPLSLLSLLFLLLLLPCLLNASAAAAAVGAPGLTSVPFSTIQTNVSKQQPVFTFSVMGQPLPIPQYKVLPAGAAVSVQNHWTGVGPFAR
jgi:hypothetical protein